MSINWNNISPLNNSRNDGFEEFVCQLVAKEKITNQQKFWRLGRPDGGKECYWELVNGKLHMWQAKYFTTSLTITQWSQINDSIITAIDNHQDLEKYYVCLPLDMPDAKVGGKTSMKNKWQIKAKEWREYAKSKGSTIVIEFWGSTELIEKLSKREYEGLKYFWFNQEEFSDEWLDNKNQESISALGTRYTKELNYDLPIAKFFDGLSRDKDFESQIHKCYKSFLERYRNIRITIDNKEINVLLKKADDLIKSFKEIYEPFPFIGNDKIPIDAMVSLLDACSKTTSKIDDLLYVLRNDIEKEKGTKDYYSKPYSNEISEVESFILNIRAFKKFLRNETCQLANNPFLMITGLAGMGKSHLLADIIMKRQEKGQRSLFLLGENFTTEEMPWTQILQNQLRKNLLDEFTFLGALNAKAESERSRIIIFIDAINEGNGRKVWPNRLKSFIQIIGKYSWLGLVISLRSSFEKLIAPREEIGTDLIVRIKHEGFAGYEYEAVKRFFNYYNIVQPTSPLLNPEFQNPLFLKLYCKSIYDRGLHEIPAGYEGITTIVEYFLGSINLKLSRPENLFFDEKKPLVKSVVEKVLLKMVETEKDYVRYTEADEIVESIFREACTNTEPFLKRLISEGVFNEDLYWDEDGNCFDVIYFAYQRFQDHLTVSMLLDKYLNTERPELSFQSGNLHNLIKDEFTAYDNQNLIEALSIQIPERINKELFEVAPTARMYHSIAEGFIQSLIWRKNETIGDNARDYVNEMIMQNEDLFNQFLNVTITGSMKPGFYFNAERLHVFLTHFSLPERDKVWTEWLQDKYGEHAENSNAVKRLIDWAWVQDDQKHINDDAILLGCITISWLLSSSNRYLRDAATKALVCLLQHRIHLIPLLLAKFKTVNDPYIIERLYAAGYGSVLRTNCHNDLVSVAEYVYQEVFNQKKVYPHILLRDYARGIVEYTIFLRLKPNVNLTKVRPPYKSKILPKKFPSHKAIEKKYMPKGDSGNYGKQNWGITAILTSMETENGRSGGYGDFGRYVFQHAFDDWGVDCKGLSNYAIQRIFELGYDPAIFTKFDQIQGSGRHVGHKERIGKKYQWIIFYELLAQVSDQCLLIDESDWDKPRKTIPYEGPWHPYVRDIDPTQIIKENLAERFYKEYTSHWWFDIKYNPWNNQDKDWIRDRKDFPSPEKIIEVNDNEGDSWLWLEIQPEWGEPEQLSEDFGYKQKKTTLVTNCKLFY